MQHPPLLDLVAGLSQPQLRQEAANTLAARLGAQEVLLLVRDPQLGHWLPAMGMAQTLPGGPAWRALLTSCERPGRHVAEIDMPQPQLRPAVALACEDLVAVLVGDTVVPDVPPWLEQTLPLLGALLQAQHRAVLGEAELVEARQAAKRAYALVEALDAARASAARSNTALRLDHRHKDEFLAMLGHELRNPLAPLASAIEVLRRPDSGTNTAHLLDMMSRQVSHLSRLVEDLLDVSRVSHGQFELRREPVPLEAVVQEALENTRPLMDQRHHTVELSTDGGPLVVDADRVRLTQVIVNLLNNAARYTDPGGRITARIGRDDAHALLDIADNGIGIAPAMIPRIFDMFARVPVPLGRSQGGLGVGLTLVRTLVELHGGQVSAASAGLGLGSTFSVRLALATGLPAIAPSPSSTPTAALPTQHSALHVRVIDDNRDAADSLVELFRALGHTAAVAYDGPSALACHAEKNADLILLDIGLPGMDGYEVARRLRQREAGCPYIIALTGYGGREDKDRSLKAGVDEHMLKPPSLKALEDTIAWLARPN